MPNFIASRRKRARDDARMVEKPQQFVPVTGVIHLHNALGVFLDVGERRIFVPQFFTSTLLRRYAPGEVVAVQVLRAFAEEEKLIA